MNQITNAGGTFEEACKRAVERSNTSAYDGCALHVNAIVATNGKDENGNMQFIVGFNLSDWYSTESTVRTYVNGKER